MCTWLAASATRNVTHDADVNAASASGSTRDVSDVNVTDAWSLDDAQEAEAKSKAGNTPPASQQSACCPIVLPHHAPLGLYWAAFTHPNHSQSGRGDTTARRDSTTQHSVCPHPHACGVFCDVTRDVSFELAPAASDVTRFDVNAASASDSRATLPT